MICVCNINSKGHHYELGKTKKEKCNQKYGIWTEIHPCNSAPGQNVITYKTASLFEASCKIGAVIGGGNEEQTSALANFGRYIGIAYQIHDDLMDWRNEERLFNTLVKNNGHSKELIDKMESLLHDYTNKARNELRIISNRSKLNLEDLVSVTIFK